MIMASKVILSINASNYGCTGTINSGILQMARENGYTAYSACPVDHISKKIKDENQIYIGGRISRNVNQKLFMYTGCIDLGSRFATKSFLNRIDKLNPALIHLHNIHSNYINIKMLFEYCSIRNLPIIWTLHDCWPMTGRCTYFDLNGCEKWKSGCSACQFMYQTPVSRVDMCKRNWIYKRSIFEKYPQLTIVTPSNWLAGYVRQSYLKKHPIYVINNGIDLSSFSYRNGTIRTEYDLDDKYIIACVASSWEARKGFEYVIKVAEYFENTRILLVGSLKEAQKEKLPKNIIATGRINDRNKMQEIYSSADVFMNPTLDDNFPTTNLEALACGTPVITFKTGGSPEAVDNNSGIVVEQGDTEGLYAAVQMAMSNCFTRKNCQRQAAKFSATQKYQEYVELYNNILENSKQ
jgi:putative colanic acid biosynthesis glycosyltransferase